MFKSLLCGLSSFDEALVLLLAVACDSYHILALAISVARSNLGSFCGCPCSSYSLQAKSMPIGMPIKATHLIKLFFIASFFELINLVYISVNARSSFLVIRLFFLVLYLIRLFGFWVACTVFRLIVALLIRNYYCRSTISS